MQDDPQLELWLNAARTGDVEAFGHIVALLRPRLAKVAARYAKAEQDREDLLQDIFLRAFRSLRNYKGTGAFEGWMHKVAVRASLDWLRAKLRRREKTESELTEDEQNWLQTRLSDNHANSPEGEMERNTTKEILNKGLNKLSPEDRTAIVLLELEGMSVAEIAGITGWSISNVKVRCHRARNRLAEWITKEAEGYGDV
jgi:RNA polymerase sigma-70 factor (ECF subfamily)